MAKKKFQPKKNKGNGKFKKQLTSSIITIYEQAGATPLNYKQVSAQVGANDHQSRALVVEILHELSVMGILKQLDRARFKFNFATENLSGRIDITRKGAGYLIVEDGEDVFIGQQNTRPALHGDIVEVKLIPTKKGKTPEGKVVKIIERDKDAYVGTIDISEKFAFFRPSSPKIHVDFFIPLEKTKGAENGDKVLAKMSDWPDHRDSPYGSILEVLGKPGEHNVEMHAILAEFGLPLDFPEEVEEAAEKLDKTISEKEIAKRRDFRGITTFTIDPDTAKDFDDALSVEYLENGNIRVGVHIADVSHYVRPNDIIDQEAVKRATSVYLVDRVVPMLPEVLSNELCSLRPNEEKLCFSAVFEINDKAEILNEWYGRTIIYSNQRYTYDDAQELIEGAEGAFSKEVTDLNRLAIILKKERLKNGAIDFGSDEVKFKLAEDGTPIGVFPKHMKEANWLIEEFMLMANRGVATYVTSKLKKSPYVFRVHDGPDPEKLKTLRTFLKKFGYKLPPVEGRAAAEAINTIMAEVAGKQEEGIVAQMCIRSMSKAVYTTENIGHYGLGFDFYSHFTSPIRRYPDVLAHRLLQAYLDNANYLDAKKLDVLCKHSSIMEKTASDAERASIKYKQVEFLMNKLGEHFVGTISGITSWGIYVELNENKCEGMVSINDLRDDNYYFDEERFCIKGRVHRQEFNMGDQLEVEVLSADLIKKQLDFGFVQKL
jgi:ribonuclease R